MKKKMKSKIIAVVMSLAVAFTMMPMMGAPAYADDPAPAAPDAITLGTGVLNQKVNQDEGMQKVFYGSTNENWYVISYDGKGNEQVAQKGAATLFHVGVGEHTAFNNDDSGRYANAYGWRDSDAKKPQTPSNLRNFIETRYITGYVEDEQSIPARFSEGEQSAIIPKTLEGGGENRDATKIKGKTVENAMLWPLSVREAGEIPQSILTVGTGDSWWLRSPGSGNILAAYVTRDGDVSNDGGSVGYTYGVRPAFNLNLSSVIFTSANPGGKSSGDVGAGSLESVGTNSSNEWKLTLESGHDSFTVEDVSTCDGKTVIIEYSDAVAAKGEYISAIITDENDAVKYYGNLIEFADEDSTSGTAKVTIDGKMESTDKLYVFNEQLNGDEKTDYSSALNEIIIPSPTGHKYGDWTSLDADQHQRVCEHDDTHVEKANHTWDAGKVTKAATEQAEGEKTYTCTVCKATKTEIIPKLKPEPKPEPKPTNKKVSKQPSVKIKAGKKSLTLGWNRIKNADGYDIFFARCNHSHKKIVCKKVKNIKGNNIFTWKKSGLKKGIAYKSYVKAYVYKDGKKKYVYKSPIMHAYTGNGNKKYTNAKSVSLKNVKKGKLTLKKGKTFKIKAKVKKVKKNKKLFPKNHVPTLRYMTSDKKIATVSSKGKIKAKAKGKCYIYAYAHNGVSKKVTVTVK